MELVAPWLAIVALIWSSLSAWLAVGVVIRRRQANRRWRADQRETEPTSVLVVRPCAGADEFLERTLLSVTKAKCSVPLEVAVGVSDESDPAVPIAERAIARLRDEGTDARLQVVPPFAPNRKTCTLAGLSEGSDQPLVLCADANVDLEGVDLDEMIRLVQRDGCGVVWVPCVELPLHKGLGNRASEAVLGGTLTAFPVLSVLHPLGLNGKLWIARREAVHECGGFDSLAEYIGEDLELSFRLHDRGWLVQPTAFTAAALGGRTRFGAVVERISRWLVVSKAQQPTLALTYPLLFFCTPLILLLAALAWPQAPLLAGSAAGLAVVARLTVGLSALAQSPRRVGLLRAVVDGILGDAVILLAWIRALGRDTVVWKGHELKVGRGGRLEGWSRAG